MNYLFICCTFILFLIENGVGLEDEGPPANNVQHFQPNIHLNQHVPALIEKSNDVKYSNAPFYGNRKVFNKKEKSDKKGKGKQQKGVNKAKNTVTYHSNSQNNFSFKNKYEALEGLTEEKQRKLFEDKSVKDSNVKNKGKECEKEECDESLSKISGKTEKMEKGTIKDVTFEIGNNKHPCKDCCKTNYVGVAISAMLAFSGLQKFANINQANLLPTFDCKIYPNELVDNYMPTCDLVYNCTSEEKCFPCNYKCGTDNIYFKVKSKKFHEHIDNNQPFKMFCPLGNNGEDVFVAEGYGSCDPVDTRKCEIDFAEIVV